MASLGCFKSQCCDLIKKLASEQRVSVLSEKATSVQRYVMAFGESGLQLAFVRTSIIIWVDQLNLWRHKPIETLKTPN